MQIDEGVLHFLQGDEQGLAVAGHRFIEGATGSFVVRLPRAAVDQRGDDARAQRKHPVFPIEEVRSAGSFEAGAGDQVDVRIELGLRRTDAGVGGAEPFERSADVGAAGHHLGGQAGEDVRQLAGRVTLAGADVEIRRPRAAKYGKGVFGRSALALDVGQVVARELEFGARTRRRKAVGQASLGASHFEVERLLAAAERVVEDRFLGIQSAQHEVLPRDFGGDAETLGVEQRGGGLGFGFGRFDVALVLAPQVDVVGKVEARPVALALEARSLGTVRLRGAGLGGGAADVEGREKFGAIDADQRAGGVEPGFGGGDVVVRGDRPVDQPGQLGIAKERPPCIGQPVSRTGDRLLPLAAGGGAGLHEIRAHGAGGEGGGKKDERADGVHGAAGTPR